MDATRGYPPADCFEGMIPRVQNHLENLLFMQSFEASGAAAAVQSRVPELLIKPMVYCEFWIGGSTGPGLLIKRIVYEEF